MTAIGRPLRGAQLLSPPVEPRVADGRAAAAARQRAAIRAAFQPLPGSAPGSGSLRPPVRLAPANRPPRSAVVPGARPRGRVGVAAWRATDAHGLFGISTSTVIAGLLGLFAAALLLLLLSLGISTSAAKIRLLQDEQVRILEVVRAGEADMTRLGREPAIRREAAILGYGQLVDPVVLVAR